MGKSAPDEQDVNFSSNIFTAYPSISLRIFIHHTVVACSSLYREDDSCETFMGHGLGYIYYSNGNEHALLALTFLL